MKRVVGSLVGLLLCLAAAAPARAQSTGLVVGEVVSSAGERVPGAAVTLEGVGSMVTDPLGRFRFAGVPAGNYRIVASREGFSTESRHLLVVGGRRNELLITLSGSAPLASPYQGGDVTVPIERLGSAVLVRGYVNGRFPGVFILDTGATLTTISWQAAEAMGIQPDAGAPTITLHTAAGVVQGTLIQVESIRVGDAEVRDVRVVILDIPGLPPQVTGLLGLSFLGRFRVSIDVENGWVILAQP